MAPAARPTLGRDEPPPPGAEPPVSGAEPPVSGAEPPVSGAEAPAIDAERPARAVVRPRGRGKRPGALRPAPQDVQARFLNMAAHELNTPLTPLRLQLHLLQAGTFGHVTARQAKALLVASRNLDRLQRLVSDILDVARLEGGKLRTRMSRFDLSAAAREAVESYEETAQAVGVRLRVRLPPGAMVAADRDRVVQIVHNLLSNALKFTPRGGTVRVACHAGVDIVRLEVRDTGAGLAPAHLAALFRPFSRPLEAGMPDVGGTGLGLFISKGLAEALGGSLSASSPGAGQGSTFTLVLAAAREGVPAAPRGWQEEDEVARRLREIL